MIIQIFRLLGKITDDSKSWEEGFFECLLWQKLNIFAYAVTFCPKLWNFGQRFDFIQHLGSFDKVLHL